MLNKQIDINNKNLETKMRNTILKSTFRVVGLALTIAFVSIFTGEAKAKHDKLACFKQAMKELNLSDQQKQQIKSIREGFRTQNESQLKELKTLRESLKAAKAANDQTKAQELKSQIKAKAEVLKPQREAMRASISNVLTPEQKAKLEASLKNCKGDKPARKGTKQGMSNDEDSELE